MFPAKGGIPNVSPRTLITGIKLDYSKHCRLPFGSYVQVHDEPSPTNSPTARTFGAITLGLTGNLQGGYKFLNLWTGKKITRQNLTHLPMPSKVIERINKIGLAQGQPKLLTFQVRHGHKKSDPDPYFPWSMMNTSRTTMLMITKTEMPILPIKVKKTKTKH